MLVVGDFNSRQHYKADTELPYIGPHLVGRGYEYANSANESTRENHESFSQFICRNELSVANTWFQHATSQHYTYKETTTNFGPPWTADRYSQFDFVLVPQRWKNNT